MPISGMIWSNSKNGGILKRTKKAFPRSTTRAEGKDAAGRRYSVLSEGPNLRYHAIRHLRGGGLLHGGQRVHPKC